MSAICLVGYRGFPATCAHGGWLCALCLLQPLEGGRRRRWTRKKWGGGRKLHTLRERAVSVGVTWESAGRSGGDRRSTSCPIPRHPKLHKELEFRRSHKELEWEWRGGRGARCLAFVVVGGRGRAEYWCEGLKVLEVVTRE
ncbi:hypothetical protein B0H19DRAFT_1075965 [Mycena capillaripes]|nr:hypothetical protein B0H19DRAFT_1075965 [Mycena capillaripes]